MATTAQIQSMIRQTALAYGVDPNLALAVAQRESGLDPNARGAAGEQGVFQLTAAAAQDVGANRNTLEGNIQGGVAYLKRMLDQFGDTATAVAAYNAGAGNVSQGVIPASTQDYVADVLAAAGYPTTYAGEVPTFTTTVWGTEEPNLQPAIQAASLLPWFLAGFGLLALVAITRSRD
jgi:soluble lytic murein transglycosylase-like protein